jgi:hypothetical protein
MKRFQHNEKVRSIIFVNHSDDHLRHIINLLFFYSVNLAARVLEGFKEKEVRRNERGGRGPGGRFVRGQV